MKPQTSKDISFLSFRERKILEAATSPGCAQEVILISAMILLSAFWTISSGNQMTGQNRVYTNDMKASFGKTKFHRFQKAWEATPFSKH